ncbi:MAG: class I SAM-dependent methyltransferase [Candidatus Tectomicrobia bacterium]|nr:class I SAM-dependent methyltransferase [Candidatus Tectomicrobia bacterium]
MEHLREYYDHRYREGYRNVLAGAERARSKALVHVLSKLLRVSQSARVLDYGSGSGLHIATWRCVFPQADLYFCDISPVALTKLCAAHPEYHAHCAEITERGASFADRSFDVVVSVEVMEHVASTAAYLHDIYRLLKPNGTFVWTTPCANRGSIEHLYSLVTGQIEATPEGFRRWRWEDPSHLRRLRSREVRQRLQRVGFTDIGFRFRAHFFSFVCGYGFRGPLRGIGQRLLFLDYALFRRLPNGASMIGFARK